MESLPALLEGKKSLIVGIVNERSVTGNVAYVDSGYHVMT